MLREHVAGTRPTEEGFESRLHQPTRLENFSDGVFAFALTLLVVSLEVPKSYVELIATVRGFTSFGFSFALLATIWALHVRYFKRYGLQDFRISLLNFVLLFFVLFFVYPLKFLFNGTSASGGGLDPAQLRIVFAIYGGGFAAVFLTFTLMYWYAWSLRETLSLNPIERFKTRRSLVDNAALVLIGLSFIAVARQLPDRWLGWAGMYFWLIPLYFVFSRRRFLRLHNAGSNQA